jgi:hypothetical protein
MFALRARLYQAQGFDDMPQPKPGTNITQATIEAALKDAAFPRTGFASPSSHDPRRAASVLRGL